VQIPHAEPGYPDHGVVDGEWDADDGPLDLMSTAALVGARAWVERELHAVVGSWVTDADDPATVLAVDGIAMRHAWRSEVLVARLPQLRELPVDRVVVAPGPATVELLEALRGLDGDDVRLAAWLEIGRGLEDAYVAHLARTTPVADAPLRRWLPILVESLRADLDLAASRRTGAAGRDDRIARLVRATHRLTG
jgi:hypothetical protein